MRKNLVLFVLIVMAQQTFAQCLIEKVDKVDFFIANKNWVFTAKHNGNIHELNTPMGVDTLSLISWVQNDTMYMTRKPFLVDEKNNLWWVYGIQKVPMKLEIGQQLAPVSDYAIMSKVTKESRGSVKTMSSSVSFGQNSMTITTLIKTFIVATKSSVSMNSELISFVNSKVIAKEEIKIGDKSYEAYKIDYEIWIKQGYDVTFEYDSKGMSSSDAAQVEKQNKKINERIKKNFDKVQKGFTNNKGYVVMPRTDWFVPGLGWVKAHTFDSQRVFEKDKAAITSITCME